MRNNKFFITAFAVFFIIIMPFMCAKAQGKKPTIDTLEIKMLITDGEYDFIIDGYQIIKYTPPPKGVKGLGKMEFTYMTDKGMDIPERMVVVYFYKKEKRHKWIRIESN